MRLSIACAGSSSASVGVLAHLLFDVVGYRPSKLSNRLKVLGANGGFRLEYFLAGRRPVEGGDDMQIIDREVTGVDGRHGLGRLIDTLHPLLLKRRHHRLIPFL